jgi:DNA-binding NarL/FixJ family response regulator
MAKSISPVELTAALLAVDRGEVVISSEFRRQPGAPWPGSVLGLTRRESEIIACLVAGASNRDIADSLAVSENTIKTHLKSIFQKLNVRSRTQAMARVYGDPSFRRLVSRGRADPSE